MARIKRRAKGNGPGLLFVIILLVVIGFVGAKFLGLEIDNSFQQESPIPPQAQDSQLAHPLPADAMPGVLIYHSYATGNYQPKEDSHQRGGKPGDVVKVGHELKIALEGQGVNTIHDSTVHDKPRYSEAFINSRKTIDNVLLENSSIQMLLDVSRDGLLAKPEDYTTVKINGVDVAKILLVVGDKNNPQIDQNLAFAQQISDALNDKYPGLSRGVRIFDAEYNGDLHTNSVRVIIGDWKGNTLSQAVESAKLLGEVVASLIK